MKAGWHSFEEGDKDKATGGTAEEQVEALEQQKLKQVVAEAMLAP
jgi:hypothetical protein